VTPQEQIRACDGYLAARTGKYEWRRVRYLATLNALQGRGLADHHTVIDVGAGWTELDVCLRVDGGWRGRYIPVDGCVDGTDLEVWTPWRDADFFVALELLEHLEDPERLARELQRATTSALIVSTPNPATTDVLGMDSTHVTPIRAEELAGWGFDVRERSFYGQPADSLFGVWTP
jgi:hypothetical protein